MIGNLNYGFQTLALNTMLILIQCKVFEIGFEAVSYGIIKSIERFLGFNSW